MYIREIKNKPITLIVSGMLWRNSLVMMDEESGSWWSHITGESLHGKHLGMTMRTIPAVQTTWASWKKTHPNSEALVKKESIKSSRYEKYFKNPERTGLFRTFYLKDRMPGKSMIFGLTIDVYALAVAEELVRKEGIIHAELNEISLVMIQSTDVTVRCSQTEGQKFRQSDEKNHLFVDEDNGSIWNLRTGLCLSGVDMDKQLTELTITKAFWFAWSTFYPNTEVID